MEYYSDGGYFLDAVMNAEKLLEKAKKPGQRKRCKPNIINAENIPCNLYVLYGIVIENEENIQKYQ